MSNKDFYMKSTDGFAKKVSCGDISMTLIAEFSRLNDIIVALSLLEDLRKNLISYYECNSISAYPINSKFSPLTSNIPDSLRNGLVARAENENCSIDTLLTYALSRFLSGTLK